MKLSTEIGSMLPLVGAHRAVALVAKAGFEAWDLSLHRMCRYDKKTRSVIVNDHPFFGPEYLKFIRELRHIGQSEGIVCNQAHAPYPTADPQVRENLKRAIACAGEAGAKICVVHPGNRLSVEENAAFYLELLPFAKSCGVKLAAENMWCWDREKDLSCFAACATSQSFLEHIQAVNDADLVACLDIGHGEMRGSGSGAPNMIRALGPHLQALHIHDNDRWKDRHWLPFTMGIDFEAVTAALREIGYRGDITMEAGDYLAAQSPESLPDALLALRKAAERIRDMVKGIAP